jgi:hypothetical protein
VLRILLALDRAADFFVGFDIDHALEIVPFGKFFDHGLPMLPNALLKIARDADGEPVA